MNIPKLEHLARPNSGVQHEAPAAHVAGPQSKEDSTNLVEAVVMMVDDEPLNIEVIQVHLEEAGYTKFCSTSEPMTASMLCCHKRPEARRPP